MPSGIYERKAGAKPFLNKLARSPHHDAILEKLAELRAASRSVNLRQFHAEHVAPLLPDFRYESFRQYIKQLDDLANPPVDVAAPGLPLAPNGTRILPSKVAERFQEVLRAADRSTREGIALALGIGMQTLEGVMNGTIVMSAKERADLLFKAMKAQDSRIIATAKVRQDAREEKAFEHVFGESAYLEENDAEVA